MTTRTRARSALKWSAIFAATGAVGSPLSGIGRGASLAFSAGMVLPAALLLGLLGAAVGAALWRGDKSA